MVEGIVKVVAATAAPTNRTPTKIKTIGLPYGVWKSFISSQFP